MVKQVKIVILKQNDLFLTVKGTFYFREIEFVNWNCVPIPVISSSKNNNYKWLIISKLTFNNYNT